MRSSSVNQSSNCFSTLSKKCLFKKKKVIIRDGVWEAKLGIFLVLHIRAPPGGVLAIGLFAVLPELYPSFFPVWGQ